MRTLLIAALVGGVLGPAPAAASDPLEELAQARRTVDVVVPNPSDTQRLTLADGSQLFGRVEFIDDDAVVFRTIAGVVVSVKRLDIGDLRIVEGRILNGEFLPADSHGTRLMFAPTARTLKQGEGYFGVYALTVPFVQVGVTDRISIGGGTPLLYFGDEQRPFWFTPKVQILARDRAQVAAGVIHIAGAGIDAGIAYGVGTFGSLDNAVTAGFGYAYSGDDRAPILMIGGEARQSRRIKWVTENWLWEGGDGFLGGGIRFLGERLTADVGVIVPLVDELFVFPMVSFAWKF